MTTYLGEKAVGVGTIKTYVAVADVLHDNTLVGNGNTEPLGVNTENIVSQQTLANTVSILNNDIQKTFENSVKKSGDTMTGDLVFDAVSSADIIFQDSSVDTAGNTNSVRKFISAPHQTQGFIFSEIKNGENKMQFSMVTDGLFMPFGNRLLGSTDYPWENVYTKKLNNGADISVPTLGGTLARIEDIQNATATLNAGITGNAQAIQKTREDYIQADSEIHQILNNHAGELTTLRGNQASLGDQVSNIESKIPQSASDTNPLITKQQLLDEEMDIRDDYNELVSELQTQITAQAGAIAGKQDKLTAGENITIEDGVISATGGGGASLPDQTGNAGKFLMTDGANVSWSQHIILTDNSISTPYYGVTLVGRASVAKDAYSTAVGFRASAKYKAVALGNNALADANNSIQLGAGTNRDSNTFKVANSNGNFEMMDANGNVPLDRLTYVTDQIGDISTALTAILGE